jgi:pyrimidine-specific ribonucleoside hydrolase
MRSGTSFRLVVVAATAAMLASPSCGPGPTDVTFPEVPEGSRAVVVDTDMGLDDALALLFLASRPDVAIRAVTVVGDGLAHCGPGVANARALLTLAGRDGVPVACGGRRPLLGSNAFPDAWRATADDLYGLDPEPAPGTASGLTAPELLRRALDGETALLTLGPFTNVARALREEPALAERVPEVVSMAGAVDAPGNAPNGVAEYNVWADPLAAKEALEALPVTLVPLDATNAAPVTPFFVDALERHRGTSAADAAHELIADDPFLVSGAYFFWDPLAAGLLVAPELGAYVDRDLLVTASQDAGAGWIDDSVRGSRVRVATRADGLGFERLFLSALAGEPVIAVRPDPDLEVTFDGSSCTWSPPDGTRAGDAVVAFRNGAGQDAVLILVRFGGDTTYAELRATVGPPGSAVTEAPDGFHPLGQVVAGPGQDAWLRVELPSANVAAACAIPSEDGSARVWLAGWFAVEP